MALLPAAFIDGGRVPASMLRMLSYVSTGGREGVVAPLDFKVQALPTPAGAVSINAGGAIIPTRFGNSTQQQSYAVANDQAFNLTITASGAGGRTDYVILRISDPQYSGQVPADPQNALYCEVVTVSALPTTYPYIALAKIVLPASTATVTNAMITDLRKLVQPRSERVTYDKNISASQDLNGSAFVDFPATAALSVAVPSWATKAIIRCDLLETLVMTASSDGEMVLMLGNQPAYSSARRYDEVYGGSSARVDHTIISTFTIPEALRGTNQSLRIRARRLNGTGILRSDANSQVFYDVEFIETI